MKYSWRSAKCWGKEWRGSEIRVTLGDAVEIDPGSINASRALPKVSDITFDFRLRLWKWRASFSQRENDGSACTNRQSADHGQNVIAHAVFVRARIGKQLSDFTDYNMRIYEVARNSWYLLNTQIRSYAREHFYRAMIAIYVYTRQIK